MRSFTADGQQVSHANAPATRDSQWSPGGDVVSARAVTGSVPTTAGSGESLFVRAVSGPTQWSPVGDSLAQTDKVSGGYQPVARWLGSNLADRLLSQPLAADPGTPVPLPGREGVLVSVPSSVPGKRDLGLAEADLEDSLPFPRIADKTIQGPLGTPQPLGYGDLDAHDPAVSADGTLAFVGTNEDGTSLFVDEGNGPVAVASLGAECAGQRPTFAPSTRAIAFVVSAADCSSSELRLVEKSNGTFAGAADSLLATSADGTRFEGASWRALTPGATSERLFGSDRIATGIAVSQRRYSEGASGAVVASSTSFADSVVGGPLAAQFELPLLLTSPKSLDSRVLKELQRLTADEPQPFVYIIGSEGAVSAPVAKSLSDAGFLVVRLAGSDRYATSVEVAKELDWGWDYDPTRSAAFLADGRNFPDALSAGPAAAQLYAPVLLTNGTSTPAVVKNYVNSQSNIAKVYSVGLSASKAAGTFGARASGNAVVGKDRYDTSAQAARRFFAGGSYVGYASGESFPDALTGGAMMGSLWEPLILVSPTSVPATVRAQATAYRAGTDAVFAFGSDAVITKTVQDQLTAAAGRQTAIYGWTSPREPNPALPATLGDARRAAGEGNDGQGSFERHGGDAVPTPRHR